MAIRRPPTTFSDSITGADLASDIAISTTGNIATTGSGTLTVAGASNLASVATGTLASAVAFPAGHVLQTVFGAHNATNPSATSSSSYVATALTIQITPIQANAKIFIGTSIGSTHRDEQNNHGGGFFMIYNTTGSAFVAGSAWRTYQLVNGGNQTHSYGYQSSTSWCVETLSGQQGTQQTYTLYVKSDEGDFYFFNGQGATNPSKMIAQELAV